MEVNKCIFVSDSVWSADQITSDILSVEFQK